jgi:precorrin-6B methylase 2
LASIWVWAIIIFALAFGIFVIWSVPLGAGWEPTSRRKVRKMLEMSGAGPSDIVYDLGSGDGRIVVEAARSFHARAIGIEADPFRAVFSQLMISLLHLEGQAKIIWGNFFRVDLSEATIVTTFLSQGANRKLEPKLMAELKPGTRVVSYEWTFDGWAPVASDAENHLSLYVMRGATMPG